MSGFKTDGISDFITFSQLANILRPYYGANKNQDDFVILLFDNILDDYNKSAKDNSEEHNKLQSYNPLKNPDSFQSDTLARYYSGTRISPDTYGKITKYINKDKFIAFMKRPENPTEEVDRGLTEAIRQFAPDATEENYCEKYADLFEQIIHKGALEPKHRAGRKKKIHYPKDTSANSMENLEEAINKAALAIAKSIKAESLPDIPDIAYCIKDKIKHNANLRRKLEGDLAYFETVNKAFCIASEQGGKPPAFIRECVNRQYLKLKDKKSLTEEDIVNQMKIFFAPFALLNPADETNSDVLRIIVSYFVQLCEVFDAPSRQNDKI